MNDNTLIVRATYVWQDGKRPTPTLRNKERSLSVRENAWRDWNEKVQQAIQSRHDNPFKPTDYGKPPEWVPKWGFDGSSTFQAETESSDCGLLPVSVIPDPILGMPNILVLCETELPNSEPHPSNSRRVFASALEKYQSHEPVFGFEQEYTLYDKDGIRPLRWPNGGGYPEPQGKFYCGVGSDEVFGRELINAHTSDMLNAGLLLAGTNAEVMPSQWEFQIGPLPGIAASDELLLARFLLYRRGEELGITVKLSPKPIAGDWNGTGGHINFSTAKMREQNGMEHIRAACEKLAAFHSEHIWVYGEDNFSRLTGLHETCRIDQFRYAVASRGVSIRIPASVAANGKGFLEDRRPAANINPYMAATALLETICGDGFNHNVFSYFFDESHPPCWRHAVIMRGLF
jgi:glutamine synthetase